MKTAALRHHFPLRKDANGDLCLPKIDGIPNLPGNFFHPSKEFNGKKKMFSVVNGERVELNRDNVELNRKFIKTPREKTFAPRHGAFGKTTAQIDYYKPESAEIVQPTWRAFDRHILRFFAFTRSDVYGATEDPNGIYRFVTINFFLEDDTLMIVEPFVKNTGIGIFSQNSSMLAKPSILVSRHRIPHAEHDNFIEPIDLKVGELIDIYARHYFLYEIDDFTRTYYEGIGSPQATDVEPPDAGPDRTTEFRVRAPATARGSNPRRIHGIPQPPQTARNLRSIRTYEKYNAEVKHGGGHINKDMQQFMENYCKCCRFFAILDDCSVVQFERRMFTIFFFLRDDTIMIREQFAYNSGRHNYPTFFKRGKIPKDVGVSSTGLTFSAVPKEEYINLNDLSVGKVINLLNTPFFIYDADAWTRSYFETERKEKLVPALDVKLNYPKWDSLEEDSDSDGEDRNACSISFKNATLVPKKVIKALTSDRNDHNLHEDFCLHFRAKFKEDSDTCLPEDVDRQFIFRYYLHDATLQIVEVSHKNSGHRSGGKWLERGVYRNQDNNSRIRPQDLKIGSYIKVGFHWFTITDWDARTSKYFDNGCQLTDDSYESADLTHVYDTLREALRQRSTSFRTVFRRLDNDGGGCIGRNEFTIFLRQLGFTTLTEKQVLEILSYFDKNRMGCIDYKHLCDNSEGDYNCNEWIRRRQDKKEAQENLNFDDYGLLVDQKEADLAESQSIRDAVRAVSALVYRRPQMERQVLAEFGHMENVQNNRKIINPEFIKECFDRLGHEFTLEDFKRIYHYMNPQDEPMSYFQFLATLKAQYHDLYCGR